MTSLSKSDKMHSAGNLEKAVQKMEDDESAQAAARCDPPSLIYILRLIPGGDAFSGLGFRILCIYMHNILIMKRISR